GTRIGLLVAILVYGGSKLMLLPGLSAGIPFLYRLPGWLAAFASIGVPVLIFLLALGAIYLYARRSDRATLFKAYLVFALTDGLLTIVLYAPGFFDLG
ncbi:MAG: hypothetical protein JSV36_14005, partial [Anaerolineae bacterium]